MDERLNCEELEQRVNGLLDLRLPLDQDSKIQQHTQYCEECRELVRCHQMVCDHLESTPSAEELDVDVSDSVVITWAHMFPDPKTPAWRTSSLIAVICLLVLVPVGLIWMAQSIGSDQNRVGQIETTGNNESGTEQLPDDTSITDTIKSLQQIIGSADLQMETLKPYRPTFQLFGVATVWESIDMTLDLILQQIPTPKKKEEEPKGDHLKSFRLYGKPQLA